MLTLLKSAIPNIFQSARTNFLGLDPVADLRVIHGSNNLATCYQFEVINKEGEKILNIKVYDKILDLVGRNGYQMVGSKVNQILGFNNQVDVFTKRIQKARDYGVTRLEISIHRAALVRYQPLQPSVKTRWHQTVTAALSYIVESVLGDAYILEAAYRKLNIGYLI